MVNFLDQSFADGDSYVFGFGSGADFQNAKVQIGYAQQDGLGLPTKDYYTDPKQADVRKAYVDYIVKTLTLAGVSDADAKTQADAIMEFETQLAAASLGKVELRALRTSTTSSPWPKPTRSPRTSTGRSSSPPRA